MLLARALEAKAVRAANRQGRALIAQARELAPDYAMAYVVESELETQRADLGWMEDPAQGPSEVVEVCRSWNADTSGVGPVSRRR